MAPLPRLAERALCATALFSLAACADVLDIPDDPELSGPWSCLDDAQETSTPAAETAIVRIQACNFVSTNCAEPATGITARLCDKKDLTCANPIQNDIAAVDGAFVFEVPTGGVLGVGFDGYLQILPPLGLCTSTDLFGAAAGLVCLLAPECDPAAPVEEKCRVPIYGPTSFYFNPPIKSDVMVPMPLPLVPTAQLPQLLSASGVVIDPTAGMVFLAARDCKGSPAAGVSFTIDKHQDRATELYVIEGLGSNTATQTDSGGFGGFVNVPPGFVGIEAWIGENEGNPQRIATLGLQVTTFTLSYSIISPSP